MSADVISKIGDGSAGPVKLAWCCAGCGEVHLIAVGPSSTEPRWEWNGSRDKPTISPSILARWTDGPAYTPVICHSFVRDGVVEFLGDCTHKLAGQSVAMRPEDANPFGVTP